MDRVQFNAQLCIDIPEIFEQDNKINNNNNNNEILKDVLFLFKLYYL